MLKEAWERKMSSIFEGNEELRPILRNVVVFGFTTILILAYITKLVVFGI